MPRRFSRSNNRSRPRFSHSVKPWSRPPTGFPAKFVSQVNVGLKPFVFPSGQSPEPVAKQMIRGQDDGALLKTPFVDRHAPGRLALLRIRRVGGLGFTWLLSDRLPAGEPPAGTEPVSPGCAQAPRGTNPSNKTRMSSARRSNPCRVGAMIVPLTCGPVIVNPPCNPLR